jgi:hypothetical protein
VLLQYSNVVRDPAPELNQAAERPSGRAANAASAVNAVSEHGRYDDTHARALDVLHDTHV